MEEIVHVHRKHVPTRWRDAAPGVRVRDYNQKQPLTFEFNGVRLEPPPTWPDFWLHNPASKYWIA